MYSDDYSERRIFRTASGSIDYEFYNTRARRMQGIAMIGLLKKLITGKKFSFIKRVAGENGQPRACHS